MLVFVVLQGLSIVCYLFAIWFAFKAIRSAREAGRYAREAEKWSAVAERARAELRGYEAVGGEGDVSTDLVPKKVGRPVVGVPWKDRRVAYQREYMRKWRARRRGEGHE